MVVLSEPFLAPGKAGRRGYEADLLDRDCRSFCAIFPSEAYTLAEIREVLSMFGGGAKAKIVDK